METTALTKPTTLVEKLKPISKYEELSEEERISQYLEVLYDYREHPLVVEAVRESGQGHIQDVVMKLLRPYNFPRSIFPIRRGRGYDKILEEHRPNELVGLPGDDIFAPISELSYKERAVGWVVDKCVNPTVLPLFISGVVYIGFHITSKNGIVLEQEVFGNEIIYTMDVYQASILGLISTGILSLVGPVLNSVRVGTIKEDVSFLEGVFRTIRNSEYSDRISQKVEEG